MKNSTDIIICEGTTGHSRRWRGAGFTLIELSVIIVIIGIILAAGTLGWNAVTQGRRLAEAKTNLYEVRDCLVRRMFYNNTYPSYTGDATSGSVADNLDCVVGGGRLSAPAEDVDSCLCNILDPWGRNVFFIEGLADATTRTPLSDGTKYVTTVETQGVNATTPDRTGSTIIDVNGNTVNYIVFTLVSAGADGLLDDSSYRDLFTSGARAAPMNPASPPNFDRSILPDYPVTSTILGDDDVYLYLTAPELRTLMAD